MRNFFKWFCLIMCIGEAIMIPINISQGNDSIEFIIAGICVILLFGFGFIKLNDKTKKKEDNDFIKNENDQAFDDEYLNISLDDGKTVKEHMQEDLQEAIKKSQGLDKQEAIELNSLETSFVFHLLKIFSHFGLDTEIRYNRLSNKWLNFTYKDMQIGRIKLNGTEMFMQILYADGHHEIIEIENIDDAKEHVKEWIDYTTDYLINDDMHVYGSSIKTSFDVNEPRENVVRCPKCGSTSIITTNKKLSLKRAAVGTALINPLAGAVGAVTSKEMYNVCQKCGHKWKLK